MPKQTTFVVIGSLRVNPFMPSGLFCLSLWTDSVAISGVSVLFIILSFIIEIHIYLANSVDPDQTPRYVASVLGLH